MAAPIDPATPGNPESDPIADHPHTAEKKVGATIGLVAGTTIGSIVAGPLGAIIGASIGSVAGTMIGKIEGEMFDPSDEHEYWKTHFDAQTFQKPGTHFHDYEAAFRAAYKNFTPGESFEQAEADLHRYYMANGGLHGLPWVEARPAAQAAWQHLGEKFPIENYRRV